MTSLAIRLGVETSDHPLRTAFLKWQCRVRQIAMRENEGRPDDAIMPAVVLPGTGEPIGHIITILNKTPGHSVTAELEHMAAKTNDPAQRRDQAIRFLSSAYYQKHREFSDILTATFVPASKGAEAMTAAGECTLEFEAYAQKFSLACRVAPLSDVDPLARATLAHNRLFNPAIEPGTIVLGFEPEWDRSSSDPKLA